MELALATCLAVRRALSRTVAQAYVDSRAALGFPMLPAHLARATA